jgi:hypothetical protein
VIEVAKREMIIIELVLIELVVVNVGYRSVIVYYDLRVSHKLRIILIMCI